MMLVVLIELSTRAEVVTKVVVVGECASSLTTTTLNTLARHQSVVTAGTLGERVKVFT